MFHQFREFHRASLCVKARLRSGTQGSRKSTHLAKACSFVSRVSEEEILICFVAAVPHLQPLVQWVCDLTMALLSSLPVHHYGASSSGVWLVKDAKSLYTLKQLLALIRRWYSNVSGIRPVLSCSMGFDVIAKLYKLLTILACSVKDGSSLPDSLIEECGLLANMVCKGILKVGTLHHVVPAVLLHGTRSRKSPLAHSGLCFAIWYYNDLIGLNSCRRYSGLIIIMISMKLSGLKLGGITHCFGGVRLFWRI